MADSALPLSIEEIDTPAVLIDIDRAAANIARAQSYADAHGLRLRPHIKTHKLPYWARKQIEAGAVGITCQKLGEAEVMADAGLTDIFLPYNILGKAKLSRLLALHRRVRICVTVDSAVTLAGLAATFVDPAHPLDVLVECETGMSRCGVVTPEEALTLAKAISTEPGLRFGGLMTYPAAGKALQADQFLARTKDLLARSGITCETISVGGSPDLWRAHEWTVATEYRPGTYIYLDRLQVSKGVGTFDDCAISVLATVVSKPTASRAVVDAGSKALTSDSLGMEGFGVIVGHPGAIVTSLSEEHGVVTLNGAELSIGDRVRILPNHACVVSNLHDEVYLVSGERVVRRLPVAARGRLG